MIRTQILSDSALTGLIIACLQSVKSVKKSLAALSGPAFIMPKAFYTKPRDNGIKSLKGMIAENGTYRRR